VPGFRLRLCGLVPDSSVLLELKDVTGKNDMCLGKFCLYCAAGSCGGFWDMGFKLLTKVKEK